MIFYKFFLIINNNKMSYSSLKKIRIQFYMKAFNFVLLQLYTEKIIYSMSFLQFIKWHISFLPIQRKKFIFLRSPHVNKIAREQLEICTYKQCLVIEGFFYQNKKQYFYFQKLQVFLSQLININMDIQILIKVSY